MCAFDKVLNIIRTKEQYGHAMLNKKNIASLLQSNKEIESLLAKAYSQQNTTPKPLSS